jgi:hypothetical protein
LTSEAGTTSSSAPTALKAPSLDNLRHRNSRLGESLC